MGCHEHQSQVGNRGHKSHWQGNLDDNEIDEIDAQAARIGLPRGAIGQQGFQNQDTGYAGTGGEIGRRPEPGTGFKADPACHRRNNKHLRPTVALDRQVIPVVQGPGAASRQPHN